MGLRAMRKIRLDKNLEHAKLIHINKNVFYNTKKEN